MILPTGSCEKHGIPLTLSLRKTGPSAGQYQKYCKACRRRAPSAFCKRGHRKTPWTWKVYRGKHRCLPCQSAAEKERRRAKLENAA